MTIVAPMPKIHQIAFAIGAAMAMVFAFSLRIQAGAPLSITYADNGEALELMKDDSLVITLDANSSTGYRWQVLTNNEAMMKPAGPPVYRGDKPGMIGAPGHVVFTFTAMATGKEILVLGYSRSNDHNPAKMFSVNIHVGE